MLPKAGVAFVWVLEREMAGPPTEMSTSVHDGQV
jgi:hypothetical protein